MPKVMGILNLTPDSFYDGGKFRDETNILHQVEKLLNEGADFIDVGGMSSRPGAEIISEAEELKRMIPAVESIVKQFPNALLSIDTIRAKVAKETVAIGACIVNDISAGTFDAAMVSTVAALQVPFVMMHSSINSEKIHNGVLSPDDNVLNKVIDFFIERIDACRQAGIKDLIIDPGFGFAKSLEQNYFLLNHLEALQLINLPILVGLSRKSMLYKPLGLTPETSLNATTVAHTIALLNGAKILRVHDVKEAKEAIAIVQHLLG